MTIGIDLKRTHWCGQVAASHIGQQVVVQGWVHRLRDHGGLIFVDVRDRGGLVQTVFNPAVNPEVHHLAEQLRNEYVVAIAGTVSPRPEGTVNEQIATGAIEVLVERLQVINQAEPPVIPVDDESEVDESMRLKYRYLDLRRPSMQKKLMTRHRCLKYIRDYLDAREFIEVETPYLTKSTPEGARDYLVPSRVNAGSFYALPQSPQLFKQILMVSGLERYYQIARCFRDEDLRADRQPEFTQLDMEMSFVAEADVMELMENLIASLFTEVGGVAVSRPFPVMTYREAMLRYGVDNPDIRFGLEIFDLTDFARASNVGVFKKAAEAGGVVRGLFLPGAELSRKELDDLTAKAIEWGAKGLAWLKYQEGWSGPVVKFFTPDELERLTALSTATPGGVLFVVADREAVVCQTLGRLRLSLGRERGFIPPGLFRFVWITEFPLLAYDDTEKRFVAVHHPFTAPNPDDLPGIETDPGGMRARAYDLVLNGQEIGGGSIRIHGRDLQLAMFRLMGIELEEAEDRFGFLMEAFRYGAPPHGGIAMGIDRIVAIITGSDSIREVIAFPKTQKAACPLTGAPTTVDQKQLRDLSIRTTLPVPPQESA